MVDFSKLSVLAAVQQIFLTESDRKRVLRSFPCTCFAVRSSSAHEGKIIIFERFQCSLTKLYGSIDSW